MIQQPQQHNKCPPLTPPTDSSHPPNDPTTQQRPQVQCALFSATMPLEVLEVTNKFMRDPVRILVKRDELTLEGKESRSLGS